MYGFVRLYADFDPSGKSADSVQTFFGLSFGIPELFNDRPAFVAHDGDRARRDCDRGGVWSRAASPKRFA